MTLDRQTQRAGDGSTQVQTSGTVIINNGITEERARTIAVETSRAVIDEYSKEAHQLAELRIGHFADRLVERLSRGDLLGAFADPAFQRTLRQAQVSAACTDTEDDVDLLVGLLEMRVREGRSRRITTNISRAVEIVDEVEPTALAALTVMLLILAPGAQGTGLFSFLDEVELTFQRVATEPLPDGTDWMEHLDILQAVRMSSGGAGMKGFIDFWSQTSFNGYVAPGIPTELVTNPPHSHALVPNGMQVPVVEHELLAGKHRLAFQRVDHLELGLKNAGASQEEIATYTTAAREQTGLGSVDPEALTAFTAEINRRPILEDARAWWDQYQMRTNIRPTGVGIALAQANLARIMARGSVGVHE